MKKTGISILLVLCILLTAAPVFCLASGAPKLTVSTEKAKVGNEVTLNVSTENNPGVMAMILGVEYDDSALEFIGPEDAGFKGWKYSGRLVWLGGDDDAYNGTIVKLKFKVLDSAKNGLSEVKITFGSGDICNYDEEIIDFAVIGGGVEIKGGQEAPSDTKSPEATESQPVSETAGPTVEISKPVDSTDSTTADKTEGNVAQKEEAVTDKAAQPAPEIENIENDADTVEDVMPAQGTSETGETENGDNNTMWIVIASIAVIAAAAAVILIRRKKNG